MRYLATLLCLLALHAHAGENRLLGTLTSTGASVNNTTTAVPFSIPPGSKVTLLCDAPARILTDAVSTATSGATKGLLIPAAIFPTSVGRALAGSSALIAMIAPTGTVNCDVYLRDGNE
jgi:hypothetical protein